jgi:hypothetical protein
VEIVWFALLAKMATTAIIVVAACLAVERTGPLVGGMVATLPVSAGPVYVFLAAEHGAAFVADSAAASLASIGATTCFVTVYAVLARTNGRLASTLGGLVVWIAVAAALRTAVPELWAAAAFDILIFVFCLRFAANWRRAAVRGLIHSSHWNIPVRAGAAMLLVAAVLVTGRLLGPGAAGELALAPVVLTSTAFANWRLESCCQCLGVGSDAVAPAREKRGGDANLDITADLGSQLRLADDTNSSQHRSGQL